MTDCERIEFIRDRRAGRAYDGTISLGEDVDYLLAALDRERAKVERLRAVISTMDAALDKWSKCPCGACLDCIEALVLARETSDKALVEVAKEPC